MKRLGRVLRTRRGVVPLPTYVPVTTFGGKYPLDDLVRPYLPRLAQAVMVSHYYAREMKEPPRLPTMVDSGGFACLFKGSSIQQFKGLGALRVVRTTEDSEAIEEINPRDVLEFQEQVADVAFTLDFPIPPGTTERECRRRQKLTVANALWALANRRRRDLPLFACIQAWDTASARSCCEHYRDAGFDGIAIGGLVPRARDRSMVQDIVKVVRAEIPDLPLHVFGLGQPDIVEVLFKLGVDSVDSSSYVKSAADGRLWGNPTYRICDPTPTDRLHLALCNLAAATGRTLPLSASRQVFSTVSLFAGKAANE